MSWLTVIAIGIATYALRASFVVVLGGRSMPRVERYLRYVPVAVLCALVTRMVIGHGDARVDLRVAGALVGILVAWRTHSVVATMAAGLGALWLLSAW